MTRDEPDDIAIAEYVDPIVFSVLSLRVHIVDCAH